MPSLDTLISRLGILMNDPRLLQGALVHSSFLNQHPGRVEVPIDAERLEFLGDSVLNFIVADAIFQRFPTSDEGHLTNIRATLIKTPTLAALARELELGAFLRLSKGEEASGARERESLLADTFEAVLAAIYLDRGLDVTRAFVLPLLEPFIVQIASNGLQLDFKSQLQAKIQAERNVTPSYQITRISGPDHRREYTVEVWAGEQVLGTGSGASKAAATQAAAEAALLHVKSSSKGSP